MPAARESTLARPPMKPPEHSSASDDLSRGNAYLILALLTAAGAWLRLSHLGSKSLWLDEGATVALARATGQHFAWVWWHGEANLQTLYFLLMRAWIHLGSSEAWIRLPSAIFGIASIPMIYLMARKFTAVIGALTAAALLAFSPTHVYFSQEARSYTLAILVVLLSCYFFVRAVENNQPGDWALWTALGIVAFYSHDFTALVLVAQATSLLFKKTVAWRRLLLCAIVIFGLAIPGLTYVFRASPENLRFLWMPQPSAKEFFHLAMFFGGGGAKLILAGALWIAGTAGIARSQRQDPDAYWRGMLIALWLIVPVATLALISLRQPMFLQRYMVFSLPATILLAALGANQLRRWRLGLILAIALCATAIPTIARDYNKPREDWRGACHAILTSAAPGDAVVFFPFYTRIMLDYYQDRYPGGAPALRVFAPAYYGGGEDARNLLQTLDQDPRRFRHVWVVMGDRATRLNNFDYRSAVDQKLQSIYGVPAVQKFADIDLLEYGR